MAMKDKVLEEYRDKIKELMKYRSVQKLYEKLWEDVEDAVKDNLEYPEAMRQMTEDEAVEMIDDMIYEEFIREYIANSLVARICREKAQAEERGL